MPIKTPIDINVRPKEIVAKTKNTSKSEMSNQAFKWWLAESDQDLVNQQLSTTNYLSKIHQVRIRQASIFTRLLSGKPLYNYLANVGTLDNSQQLPIGRPTANVVYSCTDTLVSRITQNRPKPTFLTDNSHYRERILADKLNSFIMGEFYRCKTYDLTTLMVRDACALGDGFIKVLPLNDKVVHERTLGTELLTDYNDAYYGKPRSLIQKKLVDRDEFMAIMPNKDRIISKAQMGKVDNTPLSTETVSDQFIISEGWRLPSSPTSKDGRHTMVCSSGVLLDEVWEKPYFPFAKLPYNPNMVGYFSQGLAEIIMPTQMEIYKMLIIASQAIELTGVPRIYIDELSRISEAAFNNNIGTIIKGRGQPPVFMNPTSNNPEIYEWIKWLIENAYNMAGISQLSAASEKEPGLDSGEAQRVYLAAQDSRFAALEKRYQNVHTELSYLTIDCAKDIYKRTGKYTTIYPNKDGTREIDFGEATKTLKDTYAIECFEESSLPRDPAGRSARLSEMLADGEITLQEFRRMSALPDLKQSDSLANALEERILHDLDAIVTDGEYNPPDEWVLDPNDLATTLPIQYINKYIVTDIEEEKLDMLRNYFAQVQILKGRANPPQLPQVAPATTSQLPVQPPQASASPTSNVQV